VGMTGREHYLSKSSQLNLTMRPFSLFSCQIILKKRITGFSGQRTYIELSDDFNYVLVKKFPPLTSSYNYI
jgi:hypothetical protein